MDVNDAHLDSEKKQPPAAVQITSRNLHNSHLDPHFQVGLATYSQHPMAATCSQLVAKLGRVNH